ncbi:hypothetical protein PsalMR5_03988 [Piscirickettsia salmonis]|uniref:hypothetical protein n=1 Tax=Piscirickettsia salmonis TaxID=1238 RepID=UPI0012BB0218|nr:hypothetical protein [Piscirickettsia salmonis]QGP56504.1 hypothetical protein PsalSR1_03988 [Piscirickettsia salmonis]QGP61302.1 hypothetical protein PsalBI1_03939 [Piscirickettsia salmonis]QGP66068.1 hypothetical protein PsalMR5_03988 [Piscirickettsia salmonis]
MIFTARQLTLITRLLKKQLAEDEDYLFHAIQLTVSQSQDEELEVTIRQNKPVTVNITHLSIQNTMGVDLHGYTTSKWDEYNDNYYKKPRKRTFAERCTETIVYTPTYSEKIMAKYHALFLQQDKHIHNLLQATPLPLELDHEIVEFSIGQGPCQQLGKCSDLLYRHATNPEPESITTTGCCAVL